ncbi:unnamed protein product [Phaedon cochleariae]|uniref:DNA endonuclease RBBP8 n=1 Tax=Phaedon cochleariae TaxID=80249 RepID=A0A9N9SGX9_PHACE|nr:unnamed protein product [Phaedon cochleariae]
MCTDTEAYREWIDIFDTDVSVIWNTERKELQRAAMLLGALQKEFKRVHEKVDLEYSTLRQQLKNIDQLKQKAKSPCLKKSPNSVNKENEAVLDTRSSSSLKNSFHIESPDLFRNIDINKDLESETTTNSSIIDLSLSDDDKTNIEKSPTLISKCRKQKSKFPRMPKAKHQLIQFNTPECVPKNIFKTRKSDLETSIIDCTPDLKIKKSDSRVGDFLSKKKCQRTKNISTLTQMFANTPKPKSIKNQKTDDAIDSDETCIDGNKSKSKMSITDLLKFVNEDENETEENVPDDLDESGLEEMDSMQESDQFSNGAFLDEDICLEASSPKKPKLVEPEPIVRGHARKLLNGFACKECHDFYAHMKLPPEELQKKMDECSKHRYTYRPPDETIPGFWDMTIPSQK